MVWSQTGLNLSFNKYVYAPPGTHYRGCVTITAHTNNTWGKAFIMGLGSTAVGDIGPHTANLSPNGRACGDFGLAGTVRLTGSSNASVVWYINAFDQDYSFVGSVFATPASASVDTTFVPGSELSVLEMCVHNTSSQTVNVAYELSAV